MKQLFTLLLTLVATTALWAYDFQYGDLYYDITSSSEPYTVEVTYEYHGSSNNYSSLTTVVIPETVTYNGTTYSVTSIGREAFANCSGLTSITIPNSVTSIGWYAFAHCSGLKSVTIPNSVMSIGDYAFRNCSGLTSVTIPNSVTSIGDGAFVACSSLTSIVVEDGNTIYDSRENCNAIIETASNTLIAGCQNTTIPNSVTSIGREAFADCSGLTSVTIPNSVTSIGDWAFAWCESLKEVICYAEEVPELGEDVFYKVPQSEATLYVPASALGDYQVAEQWKKFGTILPIQETENNLENTDSPYPITDTRKEIRNGQLIIIRDGVEYNAVGVRL